MTRYWSLESPKFQGVKTISNKYVLNFLRKVSIVSGDLIAILS